MSRFANRRHKALASVRRAGAGALLVTSETNVTYLSGFTGDDSYLLLTSSDSIVISDSRYMTQLALECPDLVHHIRPTGNKLIDETAQVITSAKPGLLAVEADWLSHSAWEQLAGALPTTTLTAASGIVEQLRAIKDREEIAEIRLAARYAEKAFAVLRATLRPDQTEKQVADDLEHQLRLQGARSSSFAPIVAAGPRSALPHARPTEQRIDSGDFVLMDWGATAPLYKSDLTRVLIRARISPKLERVYGLVLNAQERAIAAIRPGILARDVDAVARGVIADGGFGKHFGHGLGHGVGLDIHEAPRMGPTSIEPLRAGMVVTVEPGIYLPGWGGVRIEDDILVTRTGHEVVTNCPKQMDDMLV